MTRSSARPSSPCGACRDRDGDLLHPVDVRLKYSVPCHREVRPLGHVRHQSARLVVAYGSVEPFVKDRSSRYRQTCCRNPARTRRWFGCRSVEEHRVGVGRPGARRQVSPELDRAIRVPRGQRRAAAEVDQDRGLRRVVVRANIRAERDRVAGTARRAPDAAG